MSKYFPPTHHRGKFHCPYCKVCAMQIWFDISTIVRAGTSLGSVIKGLEVSKCSYCSRPIFWLSGKVIYPPGARVPAGQ